MPHHVLQNSGQRRVLQRRQFRLAHDPERQHVHQYQQRQDTEEADHRRPPDIRTFLCPGRIDAGAFNADEHEHRHQHHVAHLVHHAAEVRIALAPNVASKDFGLERHRSNHDEHDQRDDLGHGGQLVDERRFLDPAHHQKVHRPQQHRGAADGDRCIALAKYRKKITEGAEQQHEIANVAQPGTDPVSPRGRETHVVAKTGLGVGIHPGVQLRLAIGQGLEYEGQGQHAHGGNCPANQDRTGMGAFCHVLRQRENTATNHRAHHQGDQCTESKLLRRLRHSWVSMYFPMRPGAGTAIKPSLGWH